MRANNGGAQGWQQEGASRALWPLSRQSPDIHRLNASICIVRQHTQSDSGKNPSSHGAAPRITDTHIVLANFGAKGMKLVQGLQMS